MPCPAPGAPGSERRSDRARGRRAWCRADEGGGGVMRLVVRDFSQSEWTEIVSGFQDLSLMQLWEYGQAKAALESWQVDRAVLLEGNGVAGAVQAVLRTVPWLRRRAVRINRGPLWRRTPHEPASRV